jgi:hypothetical protein
VIEFIEYLLYLAIVVAGYAAVWYAIVTVLNPRRK